MKIRDYIIFLSSLLLFCSCSNEPEQDDGAGTDLNDISVRMTASVKDVQTRISLDGSVFTWDENDAIMLRWTGQTYQSTSESEVLYATNSGNEAVFEGAFSTYRENADLCAFCSASGSFVGKSSIAFRHEISSSQTGKLEDISDNIFLYSHIMNEEIIPQTSDGNIRGIEFPGIMSPSFAIVRLHVPSSLGCTSLKLEAGSAIAGHVQIQPHKIWGTIGSEGFFYRPTGTGVVQSTSVTVSDNGEVLGEDVYIVIAPDSYDEQARNYYCSAQSFTFVLKSTDSEFSFEKVLDSNVFNGTLIDLGTVPLNVAIKVTDHEDVPRVVLDTAVLGKSLMKGVSYHVLTATDGLENMPDPTPSDPLLTSTGISIPVQNKTDRLYIKVLGQCEGCDDVYLKAVVRNWKYDINYIAPTALESGYDGLKLNLTKMWSDTTYTDNRIGYIGCQAGNVAITPELEGTGWFNANFFAGSFGTTLWMFNGDEQLYMIDMPAKTYYSENDIMKSVRIEQVSPSREVTCRWSYRIWLRNMIFLEQAMYTPASHGVGEGDAAIEDFEGNINYQ